MGTFSAFTCTLPPLGVLNPWEARYYMHALQRGHRGLGGLGNPGSDVLKCWIADGENWHEAKGRKYEDELRLVYGTQRMYWLGQFICPKPDPWSLHKLYDAYIYFYSGDPADPVEGWQAYEGIVELYPAGQQYAQVPRPEGRGYYDGTPGDPVMDGRRGSPWGDGYTIFAAEHRHLVRGHTPNGVAHKGVGAGSVLYAAMALGAMAAGAEGVYSIEGTRSFEASLLWKSARSPKSGPLARRFAAPIEAGNARASALVGENYDRSGRSGYCVLDDLIERASDQVTYSDRTCEITALRCTEPAGRKLTGTINVDYVVEEGVKQWGLGVFVPKIDLFRSPLKGPRKVLPKWSQGDATAAFGSRAPKGADIKPLTHMLSDNGYELLTRANVGASPVLVAAIARALYSRAPDLAHSFITREDITAILSATPAGRKIVTDGGRGGALEGVSSAILRDAEAAMYRPADPMRLTLPKLSRSAQAFVNSYPED